jgi:hypothetical protein
MQYNGRMTGSKIKLADAMSSLDLVPAVELQPAGAGF